MAAIPESWLNTVLDYKLADSQTVPSSTAFIAIQLATWLMLVLLCMLTDCLNFGPAL